MLRGGFVMRGTAFAAGSHSFIFPLSNLSSLPLSPLSSIPRQAITCWQTDDTEKKEPGHWVKSHFKILHVHFASPNFYTRKLQLYQNLLVDQTETLARVKSKKLQKQIFILLLLLLLLFCKTLYYLRQMTFYFTTNFFVCPLQANLELSIR